MGKPITLIGFMGSGKSTVGKLLAREKGLLFIDLDKYIEEKSGKTIPEIFNSGGEKEFRCLESIYLNEVLSTENTIIALGGGTPCFNANMDLIKKRSTSIYLKISPETLASRLSRSKNPRPLVKGLTDDELLEYINSELEKRELYYNMADHKIESDQIIVNDLLGFPII